MVEVWFSYKLTQYAKSLCFEESLKALGLYIPKANSVLDACVAFHKSFKPLSPPLW